MMLDAGQWCYIIVTTLLLFLAGTNPVGAQNLTDEQVAVISERLAESAHQSWELGTRSQTILEVNATLYSVYSSNHLPPPSSPPSNLTVVLEPFFAIPREIVVLRPIQSNNTLGPQPLVPHDGSSADPASIGMSVLLANWTGQKNGNETLDFLGAATDQLNYLFQDVPKTSDGAISHRVAEVQLWSDFVYMVPPFLAYYGVMAENRTLILEAYNQIKLYRGYLLDTAAQNRWKHILLGEVGNEPSNDEGHWTTGNGWAAAGILRVLATIRNSQYANTLKSQQKDLANWVKEIHDGMYAVLDPSVNLWSNYPDEPVSAGSGGNFYDAAGTALLASTVFRGAVMLDQFTHVPAAIKIKETLFSPSNSSTTSAAPPPSSSPSHSSSAKPTNSATPSSPPSPPSPFTNYQHITSEGWLTPVVNPDSYGQEGSQSPESEAFALMLHAAWRDWIADGARGANGGLRVAGGGAGEWTWLGFVVGVGVLLGF